MALGDHLCADEDIDVSAAKSLQDLFEGSFAAGAVAIEAGNAGGRQMNVEFVFDPFRSGSKELNVLASAFRTLFRDLVRVSAVVTKHAPVAPVMGENDGTVGALHALATGAAHHEA